MNSAGLAGRLVALSAGAAVTATMVAGLFAFPASAATTSTAATTTMTKPITVNTPKASPRDYEGDCPAKVTFSTKVRVAVKGGATELVYRWLRGDGSKSKAKKTVVTGRGYKTVKVKEKATFRDDAEGWQRLEVLSPVKLKTKKAYFSVTCGEGGDDFDTELNVPKFVNSDVAIRTSRKGESCAFGRVTAVGTIRAGEPTWVKYRWIRNGDVVDGGSVKVTDYEKVRYSFSAAESRRGWVALEIVRPGYGKGDRAFYKVDCGRPEGFGTVSASVNAPADVKGSCPVVQTFDGTIRADGRTKVDYRWAGPGWRGNVDSVYFGRGGGSKSVSLDVKSDKDGVVKRWIEILGPKDVVSNVAVTNVTCASAPVSASVESIVSSPNKASCATDKAPGVRFGATVRVTGATTLKYRWLVNGESSGDTEKKVAFAGVVPLTHSSAAVAGKNPTQGSVSLEISAPNSTSKTINFSHSC